MARAAFGAAVITGRGRRRKRRADPVGARLWRLPAVHRREPPNQHHPSGHQWLFTKHRAHGENDANFGVSTCHRNETCNVVMKLRLSKNHYFGCQKITTARLYAFSVNKFVDWVDRGEPGEVQHRMSSFAHTIKWALMNKISRSRRKMLLCIVRSTLYSDARFGYATVVSSVCFMNNQNVLKKKRNGTL